MVEHVHKKVNNIKFRVLSPNMIKKMATAKVVTPELYDREGYPVDGGLMDIRMGVIDPGLTCKTCGLKLKECLGHPGYLELARPVMHINFVSTIYDLLRASCNDCGKVLASVPDAKTQMKKLEVAKETGGLKSLKSVEKKFMLKLRTASKCPHCRAKQNKISLDKPSRFMEKDKRLSPIEVRSRLEKISDEDLELLGMNPTAIRPEWLILTVLLVPPVSMRPSITLQTGERSEDDLTHKLSDIVRINQRLFENINAGAPEIIIEDLWDLLQYHVTTFFKNDVAQLPPARHRSGEPLKTLSDRIKSKQGRIRHNLAGKRTNFSARTVISPDSMLKINEVGIPKRIAMKLTIPEKATPWNMNYLKNLVNNGPANYPGSNYVGRPDGRKKRITDETKEELLEELEPGYVVERHLVDGDVALFNRQPSLHRMSMMCHRIKVLPGRTFRLNTAVCRPYNADFDGDEMNLHIPQTEEARAEAEILMAVQTQLISPAHGLSVMGCVQDAVTGNYLLTRDGSNMSRENAQQLLYEIGVEDLPAWKKKEVSGKEVFSALLPKDFSFNGDGCKIENGQLVEGIIDGKQLSEGKGFLLRNIHKKYGADTTSIVLTNIFKLGVKYLLVTGFSTGLEETDLPKEIKSQINKVLDDSYDEVDKLIIAYKNNELELIPGRTKRETLENRILGVLNNARNRTGEIIAEHSKTENSLLIMAESGAKGRILNIAQMAGTVGQQALRGGRVPDGYKDRTISAFERGDVGVGSRGFIKQGYKQGFGPAEFYFHSMTGRDSLIDTALRTPTSGYLYRRLSNAMQDLKVENDGTIRDSSSGIIQFKYGEDGIDVAKSEGGSINIKNLIRENL
jgi:DNA-directed RNA polymerase subunit A'